MTLTAVATGFGGPEVLSLVDADLPAPDADEVVIDVRAAGVNPVDWKVYSGAFGSDESQLPMPLGFEVSGVVTAVGSQADGVAGPISVGQEVIAYQVTGGYAGAIVTKAANVTPKPSNLDFEAASGLMLTGVTAVHLLEATGVSKDDVVVIHGAAGGVGLTAIQLGVARGATVVATASEGQHEALRALGATPVAYGPGLTDRIREVTPNGVDVALDLVGTDEAVESSLELVADRDRIATIAAFGRAGDDGIKALGGGPGADPGTEIRNAARLHLVHLVEDGLLSVPVAATYPLTEVADAHRVSIKGHAHGKIVLLP